MQRARFAALPFLAVAVDLVVGTAQPFHIAIIIVTVTLAVLAVLTVVAAAQEYIVVVVPVTVVAPEVMVLFV